MSLERQKVRDDLVAIIAAGRELSPDYDYVLADLFLDGVSRGRSRQPRLSQMLNASNRLRPLIGAACLALATLIFSLLAFHGGEAAPATNQPLYVPRTFDPDQYYGRHDWWWHGDRSYPFLNSPWSPSTSPPPER